MTEALGTVDPSAWPTGVTVAIWTPRAASAGPSWWAATTRSLPATAQVVVGVPDGVTAGPHEAGVGPALVRAASAARFVNDLVAAGSGHLLVVTAGLVLPRGVLEQAEATMREDPRVGTIAFLTNDGGLLSFPRRGEPSMLPPGGMDQNTVTAQLRRLSPEPGFAELPFAIGPLVLVSESLLTTCGPLEDAPSGSLRAALSDLSLRSRARGFSQLVDCGTFVLKPSDLNAHDWAAEPWTPRPLSDLEEADERWLFTRHPTAGAHLRAVADGEEPAFGISHNVARVKTLGLRVLVDGRSLSGPQQGTQTATVFLARALSRHDEVREVVLAVSQEPPDYARAALAHEGVRVHDIGAGPLGACGRFDIGHRPFLPSGGFAAAEWRGVVDRHVLTVLDLIAYEAGDYFRSAEGWLDYRAVVRQSAHQADGVVVISGDVGGAVGRNALPVDPTRVFVVPLGTDHLDGPVAPGPPQGLGSDRPFLLCLGTNYACRNRDVAIGAWHELRDRGYDLDLVLVGGTVPFGTSRLDEARQSVADPPPIDLGTVSAADRNWLLAHAALVLCTSSADGFGFVPFEAARMGTPSLSVSFGPFREFGGDAPVWAAAWSASAFADAAQRLLDDPGTARGQLQARLAVADRLIWERTADSLVRAYRELLARPPAVGEEVWAAADVEQLRVELDGLRAQAQPAGPAHTPGLRGRVRSWLAER